VKQKENIFEELNKMRNLIHARPGVVISEQNASADAGTIMREIGNNFSDEAKIVNILKNYKDKASFKNFVDQYKAISGKDFGADIIKAVTPTNDPTEWNDLKAHLSTFGVALTSQARDPRQGGSYAIFGGLSGESSSGAANTEDAWKNPNVSCVTTQPDAKKVTLNNGSIGYRIGTALYYSNGRKQMSSNQPMTNYSCSTEFKSGVNNSGDRPRQSSVNTRFADSAKSLGIENAKMDVTTLQTMLKSLQGDTTTASPTQGTPDIEQLKAALNQLKQ
jgi:hypothetical protein